jgi:hypothetical protein
LARQKSLVQSNLPAPIRATSQRAAWVGELGEKRTGAVEAFHVDLEPRVLVQTFGQHVVLRKGPLADEVPLDQRCLTRERAHTQP